MCQNKYKKSLEARESHFGWYISGPVHDKVINTFMTKVSISSNSLLYEQIKRFWELEEVEKNNIITKTDEYCEQLFQSSTVRQPNGRYSVRLPFKEEFPNIIYLGPSRNTALAQYHRMEQTLNKTPTLKKEYDKVLQEYIDLGHMEAVKDEKSIDVKQYAFFLLHHAVYRPESKSTKVRIVFNASKKSGSGFSLNDVLHQGPALQNDLMQLVLRWRNYKYVFTGDIEKMYRQIMVHESDRPYQQILFRSKEDKFVRSYQLKTVTFGINCAPFLAIRTLLQLSKDCKDLYPEASNIIKKRYT